MVIKDDNELVRPTEGQMPLGAGSGRILITLGKKGAGCGATLVAIGKQA